jgi:hypothetical protein
MTIPWTPLLGVFVVAFGGAVVIAGLLVLAQVGLRLRARNPRNSSTASPRGAGQPRGRRRRP